MRAAVIETLFGRYPRAMFLVTGLIAGGFLAVVVAMATDLVPGPFFWLKKVERKIDRTLISYGFKEEPERSSKPRPAYTTFDTALERIEVAVIPAVDSRQGGAISQIGDHIVFATSTGRLGTLVGGARNDAIFSVDLSDVIVPTHVNALDEHPIAQNPKFLPGMVRVADLVALPTGPDSGSLYVSHHELAGDCVNFVISQTTYQASTTGVRFAVDWRKIFEAFPCIEGKDTGHFFAGLQVGGKMEMRAPGKMLVTVGDHEFDGYNSDEAGPQLDDWDFGKAIELDLETLEARHIAKGLRNSQGLVVARDGTIWATDHGPQGGDEVNLLEEGENYGWPKVTYGMYYGQPPRPWPANQQQAKHEGFTKPGFVFVPSVAVAGLAEADGEEFPLWDGDLIATTLKTRSLWRLRREGSDIRYGEHLFELEERLRDIIRLDDGRFAIWTDSGKVVLVRRKDLQDHSEPSSLIVADRGPAFALTRTDMSVTQPMMGERRERLGAITFAAKCSSCHHRDKPEHMVGPHLVGLAQREIGGAEGFGYSQALINVQGDWTAESLRAFLYESPEYAGTTMPAQKLNVDETLTLVKYLLTEAMAADEEPATEAAN